MHLVVLGAFWLGKLNKYSIDLWWSQCTFWCWVLSDEERLLRKAGIDRVLMRLVVLGAF